jgi:hypothetical protein
MNRATFERKVEVFEHQMNGWILDHAAGLAATTYPHRQHAGMAILMLVSSYFEAVTCFLRGESNEGKSKAFFKDGFVTVFFDLDTSHCGPRHEQSRRSSAESAWGTVHADPVWPLPRAPYE